VPSEQICVRLSGSFVLCDNSSCRKARTTNQDEGGQKGGRPPRHCVAAISGPEPIVQHKFEFPALDGCVLLHHLKLAGKSVRVPCNNSGLTPSTTRGPAFSERSFLTFQRAHSFHPRCLYWKLHCLWSWRQNGVANNKDSLTT